MTVDDKGAKQGQAVGNKSISPLAAYRWYNAAVATLVFYRYLTDPDASSVEFLFDIVIHMGEAAFPNSAPELPIAANLFRAAQVTFFRLYPPMSTVPPELNSIDILNHMGNVGFRLSKGFHLKINTL